MHLFYKRDRLLSFVNENNILNKNQFSFRKSISTGDALAKFVDEIYKLLDESTLTIAVFIDLAKAFDTLKHQTLLKKT